MKSSGKPILRLGFTDTFGAIEEFFTETLSTEFEIVRDDENPDYLIFGDRNFGENNLRYDETKCIKIFYTGENQRPYHYRCHYSISFDHDDNGRNFRLPLYVIYDWDNKRKKVNNSKIFARTSYSMSKHEFEQRKFCSFVVKNGGCQKRNDFFHMLSEYQPVDAAGPLFNNVGYILEGGERAVQTKLEFLPKYRFNLCFENSSYPGYATEKLYEAMMGNTIPIYWGSPTIEMDFNPDAFLNWHDYDNDEDFLEAIKRVNEDYYLYQDMYCQPLFGRKNKFMDLSKFVSWFMLNVYKGSGL